MIDYTQSDEMDIPQTEATVNVLIGFGKSTQLQRAFDSKPMSRQEFRTHSVVTPDCPWNETSEYHRDVMETYLPERVSPRFVSEAWGTSAIKLIKILRLLKEAIDHAERLPHSKYRLFLDNVDGLGTWCIEALMSELDIIERNYADKIAVYLATNDVYLMNRFQLRNIVVCSYKGGKSQVYRPYSMPSIRGWAKSFSAGDLYTMSQYNKDLT